MLESFLKYIAYEKRLSPHTISSYKTDLDQFQVFLGNNFNDLSPEEADHTMLRSWIVQLAENGIGARSINRKMASLRAFYKFLMKQEVIEKDPASRLRALKTSKKLPQFVNEKDINYLLDHGEFGNDFKGIRARLILELFYNTGIRLSELIALRESDINFYNRTIIVLGKRNKERVIPFSASLGKILEEYLYVMKKTFSPEPNPFVFVTDKGKKCYPSFVYLLVKKYLGLFTTMEKRSPHVLRHTFATHLLNRGAELNAVKDLLGHTSLAATQVYTHNSLNKLKSVFDQAHPKA